MARTGRPKQLLVLEPGEREQLQRWARRPKTEQRLATRSRIVLRCADGLDNDEVAAELHVNEETVKDVVGLYLDPPERALVLCVDEKSQIQALDRSQPVLPILPGTPARMSHDYKRHGTTSLFAALDLASGKVIGDLHARHRALEFKKFLDQLEHEVPPELEVHLILDNYATHKTPTIKRWLLRHPRFVLHFIPKSAS